MFTRPATGYPSAKDYVAYELRSLLHAGRMPPGSRVSIDEIAERYGVSRTPVRDAIFALSAEGLLTVEPRVGVFVRKISQQEVFDLYQIREALDPVMATLATERSTSQERFEQLEAVRLLEMAAAERDVASYVELLEQRREVLLAMARADALRDSLRTIDGRVRLLRFRNLSQVSYLDRSAFQHRSIAEAIYNGDGSGAAMAMALHTRDARRRIFTLLADGEPDGVSPVSMFVE